MGADLHFISQWEMCKISFLEGQGETGCLIAQPPALWIELVESWTSLARLCVSPLLNRPKDESMKKVANTTEVSAGHRSSFDQLSVVLGCSRCELSRCNIKKFSEHSPRVFAGFKSDFYGGFVSFSCYFSFSAQEESGNRVAVQDCAGFLALLQKERGAGGTKAFL